MTHFPGTHLKCKSSWLTYAVGQPFPSPARLLVPPYLHSTSYPAILPKSVVLIAHPEVTVIYVLCGWVMVSGMWSDTTGVSIRVLIQLPHEQSRETFLEQEDTVQI